MNLRLAEKRTLSWIAIALAAFAWSSASAAERVDELRRELEAMHETDQAQRKDMATVEREHGASSPRMAELWKKQTASDTHNIQRLEAIIAEIGWPKRSVVGERAASAAFLILQHSDLAYQKKYLPLTRAAVAENEMRGSSLALLEDRVLLREGKKQIYGSQVQRNEAGEWEARSLEDPEHVDQRRASVGLPPLAEYLAGFAQRSGGKVADRSGGAPLADAPPLRQDLFAATDDARTAYDKLRQIKMEAGPAGLRFQLACHDFCLRFPEHPLYGATRVLAARAFAWLREPELAELKHWDPTTAQDDPKLNGEQRAEAAMNVASRRAADQVRASGGDWTERHFDALIAALPPHRETQYARQHLIRAALEAPPARAIPALRELYPDDPAIAACIQTLEALGRPCELAFTAFDGRAFDVRAHRGKVVMVVFWTGGDSSSSRILPQLLELGARHGLDSLSVVGVSFDRSREAVQEVIDRHGITWPIAFDGQAWTGPIATRFLVKVLPSYLLIDRQGVLRFRGIQPTVETAHRQLATLLAEPPPPAAP
jgi:hypothetical protein